jgi:hypothetical protein
MGGKGLGSSAKNWSWGLRERISRLEEMGGDPILAQQAREQVKAGDLNCAEELASTMELRLKSWLRR